MLRNLSMPVAAIRSSDSGLQSRRPRRSRDRRPSPVRRAADNHATSDDIDDDNNEDESSDDDFTGAYWRSFDISVEFSEDESSDSGVSFDDVPFTLIFPNSLGGFEDDDLATRGVIDHDTDGAVINTKHNGQHDPNAVFPIHTVNDADALKSSWSSLWHDVPCGGGGGGGVDVVECAIICGAICCGERFTTVSDAAPVEKDWEWEEAPLPPQIPLSQIPLSR